MIYMLINKKTGEIADVCGNSLQDAKKRLAKFYNCDPNDFRERFTQQRPRSVSRVDTYFAFDKENGQLLLWVEYKYESETVLIKIRGIQNPLPFNMIKTDKINASRLHEWLAANGWKRLGYTYK